MEPSSLSAGDLTYAQVAGTIDHSLLKPELTIDEVVAGCDLAARYRVASVCVRPSDVALAAEALRGTEVAVGTVVAFPHGDSATVTKVHEAELAVSEGATELDMVLHIGRLLSGDDTYVEDDIRAVVNAGGGAIVKVILENAYLNSDHIMRGCKLVEGAGAHYVKTSTGYAPSGATLDDLRLMRASVGNGMKVKAAHGIRTLDALLAVIEAGADRCGATQTAAMLDDYRERTGA